MAASTGGRVCPTVAPDILGLASNSRTNCRTFGVWRSRRDTVPSPA